MQTSLLIVFYVGFIAAGGAGIMLRVRPYRIAAVTAFVALALGATLEYGLPGLLTVAVVVAVLIPTGVLLAATAIRWITWRSVLRTFPDQPRQPPGSSPTLGDIYRVMWLA